MSSTARRPWRSTPVVVLGVALLGLVSGPASAGNPPITLEGYYAYGGQDTMWELSNTSNYDQCSSDDDWYSIEEGYWHYDEVEEQDDTWDGGMSFAVDGEPFNDQDGSGTSFTDATGETITTDPETISGLEVSVQHFFFADRPTVRSLLMLVNNGTSDVTPTVTFDSSVGSDESTEIRDTSDGDTTFTTDDRWIVTSDHATTPGDPVATHVLSGEDADNPVATIRQSPENDDDTEFGENCVWVEYEVTVPAGETLYLMTFAEQRATNEDALAAAADFNDIDESSDLLTGLSEQQLAKIVNWQFFATCPGFEGSESNQIIGTGSADVLLGTAGPDVICGLGGGDELRGFGDDDVVLGGGGNDLTFGGAGTDEVNGGSGSDEVRGGLEPDELLGRRGSDTLYGGDGGDTIKGGDGLDDLHGASGFDALNGGPDKDFCQPGADGGTEVNCEA